MISFYLHFVVLEMLVMYNLIHNTIFIVYLTSIVVNGSSNNNHDIITTTRYNNHARCYFAHSAMAVTVDCTGRRLQRPARVFIANVTGASMVLFLVYDSINYI